MSQWTHVAAVIRFDGVKGMTPDPNLNQDVPQGSEDGLHYGLVEVGEGIPRFTVTIWGDLRDFNNIGEIIAYLERITKGHTIRSGIAEIDVECRNFVVVRYSYDDNGENGKWEIVKSSEHKW